MISGTLVVNTRVDGKITPTDFLLPSARITVCEMHLPSKKIFDFLTTDAWSN
jgi:hypothetical protein